MKDNNNLVETDLMAVSVNVNESLPDNEEVIEDIVEDNANINLNANNNHLYLNL